jgi:hypothetical protein
MPKWAENTKKASAKEREQQKKDEKKMQESQKKEEAIWKETDPKLLKKQAKEHEKRDKERQQKEKQLEKKQLYEEELQQISANKSKLNTKEIRILKDDVAKVNQKHEQALQEKYQPDNKIVKQVDHAVDDSDELDDQLDKEFNNFYKMQGVQADGLVVADNLEKALSVLTIDGQVDKHPEKRVKGAWKTFVDEQLPAYRKEYPSLKRGQILNFMWKEFEKSEHNPMNNANKIVWEKKKKTDAE